MSSTDLRIMVVSDTHYLARPLYEGSDLFLQAMRSGDGKVPQYGEELMAALLETAADERPDALLITGDLTFNGEAASHRAMADWLRRFRDRGIPVWVIPGNHDINTPMPVGFQQNGYYSVSGVSEADFAEIYTDFLLRDREDTGFSYTLRLHPGLWVAMTDVAFYKDQAQTFGVFLSAHADWLERVLREAESAGAAVVTASHHSLISHTAFQEDSYRMFGHESMGGIVRQHGQRLHLSGHLHIQHIADADRLTDAALGAFCLYPHRYAIVTLAGDGRLTYEAKELRHFPLADATRAWFLDVAREKQAKRLTSLNAGDAALMADYSARFNLAYFSGTYENGDPAWKQDPAYALWMDHRDLPFASYLLSLQEEPGGSHLYRDFRPDHSPSDR